MAMVGRTFTGIRLITECILGDRLFFVEVSLAFSQLVLKR
jgi:hypothetical protein